MALPQTDPLILGHNRERTFDRMRGLPGQLRLPEASGKANYRLDASHPHKLQLPSLRRNQDTSVGQIQSQSGTTSLAPWQTLAK